MTCRPLRCLLLAACWTLGCGGRAAQTPAGEGGAPDDASADVAVDSTAAPDATGLPCGTSSCTADQICVYPTCGCLVAVEPVNDAGLCPDGDVYSDAFAPPPGHDAGACIPGSPCTPGAPFCWSPDGGSGYGCSGADGSIDSSYVNEPAPVGSSHVCYETCI
jgi:hypothetical protein